MFEDYDEEELSMYAKEIIADLKRTNARLQSESDAALLRAEGALHHIMQLGHNDQCIFCGFKDRVVIEYDKAKVGE